jgi:hypothetical protein
MTPNTSILIFRNIYVILSTWRTILKGVLESSLGPLKYYVTFKIFVE